MLNLTSLNELRQEISKYVIGQREAVDKVSLFVFKHFLTHMLNEPAEFRNLDKQNLLLTGPTGSGKTYLIKTLCTILGIPFVCINAKSLAQENWSGLSFPQALYLGMKDILPVDFPRTIVLIDEFDKLCLPNSSSKGDPNTAIQYNLLKFLEGSVIKTCCDPFNSSREITLSYAIDTKELCFIFAGSFSFITNTDRRSIGFNGELEKELDYLNILEKEGMIPEIAGRMSEVVTLKPHTEESLGDYWDSDHSVLGNWKKKAKLLNMENQLELAANSYKDQAIKNALNKNLGMRGLSQEMQLIVNKALETIDIDLANIHQDIYVKPFQRG